MATRGFTVVEVLVVTAMVLVLASILIVAVNAAVGTSQKANTMSLMNAVRTGLVQFKSDMGYLPPVLDDNRDLFLPPDSSNPNNFVSQIQDWHSITTLSDYLVGYGHHYQDGYGYDASAAATWPQETPPVGIRNPGSDGVWGATIVPGSGGNYGELSGRMASSTNPNLDTGRVYGPYIELSDKRSLARLNPATGTLSFPGESAFEQQSTNPLVLVDYWGEPIRYYRRAYSTTFNAGAPVQSALGVPDRKSKLSEVILLRPPQAKQENIVLDARSLAGNDIDLTTYQLQTGDYALFSAGPDRQFNAQLRVDDPNDPLNTAGTDMANQDNIVEVGP
jgi:prepilin-type N-terminal cleavage/methylation domain-containing protein